jgi:hypothetical protein
MTVPAEYIFIIALIALLIGAIIIAIIVSLSNNISPVDYAGLSINENLEYSTNSIYTWDDPIQVNENQTVCNLFLFKTVTQTSPPHGTDPPLCVSYQPQVPTLNTALLDATVENGTGGVDGSIILIENQPGTLFCQDPDMIAAIKLQQNCLCRSPTGSDNVMCDNGNTVSWCIGYDGQRYQPGEFYEYYASNLCRTDSTTVPSLALPFCNGATMILSFNYFPVPPSNPSQGICLDSCDHKSDNGTYAWNCKAGDKFANCGTTNNNLCENNAIYGGNIRCLVAVTDSNGKAIVKNGTCDFDESNDSRKIMRITATFPNLETGLPLIPPDFVAKPSSTNTINGINFRIIDRVSGLCLNGDTGTAALNFSPCGDIPNQGYAWLMLPPGTIVDDGTGPTDPHYSATTWPQQLLWLGNNPIPTNSASYASLIDNLSALPAYTVLPSSSASGEDLTMIPGPLSYSVCGDKASSCKNHFSIQDFVDAIHSASQAIDPLLYHTIIQSDANFLAQYSGGANAPVYTINYNYDSPFITGEYGFD